jgi:apolipoprotein N-acyltransferase
MIFLQEKKYRFVFSILSGILMFISFPYTGSFTFLVFVSWVPLLIIENSILNYKSSKHLFVHAYLTFLIYNIGTTWWIWYADEGGMLFAVLLNSLLMALFFLLFHLIKKRIGVKYGLYILLSTWVTFEYLHYSWELSWPWLNFGNVFSITPQLIQWYQFTGVLGGSVWILIVNYFIFRIIIKNQIFNFFRTKLGMITICLLLLPISFSYLIFYNYKEFSDPIELLVIQPNIDPYTEKFSSDVNDQMKKIFDLAIKEKTPKTELVIAPETAISASIWENNFAQTNFYFEIKNGLKKLNEVPFLTGASTLRQFDYKNSSASRILPNNQGYYESYNTSVLFSKNVPPEFIHKSKLVLGVEKIPFNNIFPWLEDLAINLDGASGSLGIESSARSYAVDSLEFTSTVCYESVYGEFVSEQVMSGAQFISVITNDGWWKDTPGYKQHASFSRLRAVENRRSVARSANTGISCFINQKGEVISKTKWNEAIALKGTINKNDELTFYTKNGDILGVIFTYFFMILIVFSFAKILRDKKRAN